MNTKGLSNQEIYDLLIKMLNSGEKITYEDLKECVSTRSVVDTVAKQDAITVFFSGEDDKFIKNLSSGDNSKIRMIRRTEASKFLADDQFEKIVKNIIRRNYPEVAGNRDAIYDIYDICAFGRYVILEGMIMIIRDFCLDGMVKSILLQ